MGMSLSILFESYNCVTFYNQSAFLNSIFCMKCLEKKTRSIFLLTNPKLANSQNQRSKSFESVNISDFVGQDASL